MKTFSHILRYILVAAALASCQRTDDSVAEPVVSESFTATIESFEDQTRTALDGKYAVWTSGDEIAVFQGRSTADRYMLYDLKASSFRLAERAEDEGDAFEANLALYPYSESLTCEKTDAGYKIDNISFPSVQQYKENSFSEESFFMAALTAGLEDRVLDFRNICGGLRLYITGEKNVEINKIVLSGNDDERLAGVGSVTCDSEGNVSFNGFTGSASERQISLNCGGIKLDEQDASQFIISLPPVIFSKGFTVTLNAKVDGADVTYTRSTDKPHTIRKSTFLSMPSFVFGEVPPEPVLNVSPSSLTFAAEGGEQKVTLSSNQDWAAESDSPWLSVTPSSGTASEHAATITFKASANESSDARTAKVTFVAGDLTRSITVSQAGVGIPSALCVSKTELVFSSDGGEDSFELTSSVENWTSSKEADWLSVTPSSGVPSESPVAIKIKVNSNDGETNRTAIITFTAGDISKTVTVTQSGKVIPPSLEVNKTYFEVSAEGASLPLEVTSNVNWTASTDSDWVSISPSFGVASDKAVSVTLTVNANDTLNERTATVTFTAGDLIKIVTVIQIVMPTVTTLEATNITATSAKVGGNVTATGGAEVTERGIVWNTSKNPTTDSNKTQLGSGLGSFSTDLINLTVSTTYYVRAYAINSVGVSYGEEISFTTGNAKPTVITVSPSEVTSSSAVSGGNVTSDGGSAVTARGVVWSKEHNPTISLSTKTTNGTGIGSYVSSISGLEPGVKYYVRAYATNANGTTYGEEVSFTTNPVVPTVSTNEVSDDIISDWNIPVLGGNVTETGGAEVIERGLVWSSLPNPTVEENKIPCGSGLGQFGVRLYELSFGTRYYIRAYAINSAGISYGNEVTFYVTSLYFRYEVVGITENNYPRVRFSPFRWSDEEFTDDDYFYFGYLDPVDNRCIINFGPLRYLAVNLVEYIVVEKEIPLNTKYIPQFFFEHEDRNITVFGKPNSSIYVHEIPEVQLSQVQIATLLSNQATLKSEVSYITDLEYGFKFNTITNCGIVWSTEPNPTIALQTKTDEGGILGTFTSTITGLTANTTYYARPYAINQNGVVYGEQIIFTTKNNEGSTEGVGNEDFEW